MYIFVPAACSAAAPPDRAVAIIIITIKLRARTLIDTNNLVVQKRKRSCKKYHAIPTVYIFVVHQLMKLTTATLGRLTVYAQRQSAGCKARLHNVTKASQWFIYSGYIALRLYYNMFTITHTP